MQEVLAYEGVVNSVLVCAGLLSRQVGSAAAQLANNKVARGSSLDVIDPSLKRQRGHERPLWYRLAWKSCVATVSSVVQYRSKLPLRAWTRT